MNLPTLLSSTNVQAIGWMLVHFVWQGLAVAAVLAAARIALKKPRLRYVIACAALLVMVLLPLATFVAHRADAPSAAPASGLVAVGSKEGATPVTLAEGGTHEGFLWAVSAYSDRQMTHFMSLQFIPVIVLCWGVGVLILSLRLLGGGWMSHRLKRAGTSPLPAAWQRRVRDLAQHQGIRHSVEVVTSTVAAIPMVVGVFRPVILIPVATFLGLSQHQLEAILLHELAHVRRYDNLVNLLQRLVETAFFFHPAVWWVSRCIRTEREYCCDDDAVAGSDPIAYAAALASLEEMRSPALAAAATSGSLLARVRRLLAADGPGDRDGLSSYSVASLAGLLAVLVLAGFAVEGIQAEESNPLEGERAMNVMVDVNPARPAQESTLASSLSPLLRIVGRPEWSPVRLQGVMGHAFLFQMHEGGRWVYHDNLDWGLALDVLGDIAHFREFHATKKDADIDLPALKREARDAVLESLQQGIPALVWQPISLEQKAAGHSGYCWGLIVGYDEAAETYTIRHPFVSDQYTVRYDAIGHADPVEWFNVRIFAKPGSTAERTLHLAAMQNAIAFAQGTRHGDGGGAYGFAAYELWREAFASEEVQTKAAHHHITVLRNRRRMAAAYLREIRTFFPAAAESLGETAAEYERELEALEPLHDLITAARAVGKFTAGDRTEAGRLIGAALQAERAAISKIETALALVDEG